MTLAMRRIALLENPAGLWLRYFLGGMCLMLCVQALARAQLICVQGKNCSCNDERVSPNLVVAKTAKLDGSIFDPSGSPMAFEKTVVEVRNLRNNSVLHSAVFDEKGNFDLGPVPTGRFRFVV